jgi:hypothetical protein
MNTTISADAVRFPPALSDRIAAEIEAIAWNESDLLGDIPEDEPDARYLASRYADQAASAWEEANGCPEGYLPYRIVDSARRALVARIEAELARRDHLVEAEYRRRLRQGSIDANGVGHTPTFYGLVDEQLASPPPKIDMASGRESGRPGPITPEVVLMSQFVRKGVVALWHFECPECGFSDAEFGGPASSAESIHCEVCLEDGQTVRLKRWPAEENVPSLRAA